MRIAPEIVGVDGLRRAMSRAARTTNPVLGTKDALNTASGGRIAYGQNGTLNERAEPSGSACHLKDSAA